MQAFLVTLKRSETPVLYMPKNIVDSIFVHFVMERKKLICIRFLCLSQVANPPITVHFYYRYKALKNLIAF